MRPSETLPNKSPANEIAEKPLTVQPQAVGSRLRGKRAGIVVLSSYPQDPRPRRVADAFVQQGMHVDYICSSDGVSPSRETVNGTHVFRIPIIHKRGGKLKYIYEYSAFILASAAILLKRSLRKKYDLIYINNMPDVLVACALPHKLMGTRVILDMHDPMPELMATIFNASPKGKSIRLLKWMEKWSMARADKVVTVNLACQRIFAGRSCAEDKVAVIMNSPDENLFRYRSADSYPERSNADRPFVIMYHGALVERNGVDLAVEAVARIHDRAPNTQLHIYGASNQYAEAVMQSARKRGLEQCVLYFGQKSLEEIVQAIQACDVGVIPNRRNAFTDINTPTRIFEYLALGKPVVAPSTPGIQHYFDKDSLLFFESGNVGELADRIAFAISHPAETRRITERGQEVYRRHRWERERDTLLATAEALLTTGEAAQS
jgi:glycosyltransferase involved in cell wall biosynthesis